MDYKPRKMMFKAWNKDAKLLMRLNAIECNRGELFKKDHVLLQFTGVYDKQQEEVYEMDVLLIGSEKFLVIWDAERNGWMLVTLKDQSNPQPFLKAVSANATRLWNYFESEKSK
jgi:hypothetical protein